MPQRRNLKPWPVDLADPFTHDEINVDAYGIVEVGDALAALLDEQPANWGPVVDTPARPKDGAPKAKWVEFAEAMGVAGAEALTRVELVARFPEPTNDEQEDS